MIQINNLQHLYNFAKPWYLDITGDKMNSITTAFATAFRYLSAIAVKKRMNEARRAGAGVSVKWLV